MKPHVQIQRTNSAPVRPNPLPASMFGKNTEGMLSFVVNKQSKDFVNKCHQNAKRGGGTGNGL